MPECCGWPQKVSGASQCSSEQTGHAEKGYAAFVPDTMSGQWVSLSVEPGDNPGGSHPNSENVTNESEAVIREL